jgi:hypothetical protein
MIRQKTGFERVRSFFSELREYRCRDCDAKFRAPDRRRLPRGEKAAAAMQSELVNRHLA